MEKAKSLKELVRPIESFYKDNGDWDKEKVVKWSDIEILFESWRGCGYSRMKIIKEFVYGKT